MTNHENFVAVWSATVLTEEIDVLISSGAGVQSVALLPSSNFSHLTVIVPVPAPFTNLGMIILLVELPPFGIL